MIEAHRLALLLEHGEVLGSHPPHHREVALAGAQVLAQVEHLHAVVDQVAHRRQHLLVGLA